MICTQKENLYKYQLSQNIGVGNFSEVWLAHEVSVAQNVAVKIMDTKKETIDQRLFEAKIGSRLKHDNVTPILYADVCNKNGNTLVVIAMPYCGNGNILSKLNSLNFLDIPIAIKYLTDVLKGLEYLHENGFYHGDIKPKNILIGDNNQAALSDYGLTTYSPTHDYVIPRDSYLPHIASETITSNIYNEKTDIYQLGMTAFRLLNGIGLVKDKFQRDRAGFKDLVLEGKVITDKDYQLFIPSKLKRIIKKATSHEPSERYATAIEMRRDLEKISFPGYCTSNNQGKLVARTNKYDYWFEVDNIAYKKFRMTAYKTNLKSNRTTKVTQYSLGELNESDLNRNIKKYLQNIILGK